MLKNHEDHYIFLRPILMLNTILIFKNNDYFREILLCGQQHRITLIIIAQYISSISKDFRSKFDYIFIFQDNTEKELMQIYDTYRTVSDFEQFYNLFNTIIS